MKKIFVSMGLVAAGTASLQAAYAPDMRGDTSKVWKVSASLRGFYDDNYLARPHKEGSVGFEVSPSLDLNIPLQQTEIGMKYTYGLYYYQKREDHGQNPIDQTHQFDLWLDHAFSPRWEARLQDTVVVAQEPDLLAGSGAASTAQRISGNNVVNTANLGVHTVWTRLLSTQLSYDNRFVSYENGGARTGVPQPYKIGGLTIIDPKGVAPSYVGLLDRVEQSAALDVEWNLRPETVALVGYQIGLVNFIGDEKIAHDPITGSYYNSDSRDNLSHYGYVGVSHQFLPNLSGNARVGVQYTDYYNDPSASSSLGPYATASLVYTYSPGSYAQVGLAQTRNATDTVQVDSGGKITQDQESTVVYASVNQRLMTKLTGSVVGKYQHSTFHQGGYGSQSAEFYNLGVNLAYTFNRHFSSDVGYNFDYYTTPVPSQGYTRNRVYLGVTASY
jgi:Putative beta-barrel porin 2